MAKKLPKIRWVYDAETWSDLCYKYGIPSGAAEFGIDEGGSDSVVYKYASKDMEANNE